MIDALINRIKDAYFDLERDTARGERFVGAVDAYTPGAVLHPPSRMAAQQGFPPNTPLGPQPEMAPQPAPEPSLLDVIGARR